MLCCHTFPCDIAGNRRGKQRMGIQIDPKVDKAIESLELDPVRAEQLMKSCRLAAIYYHLSPGEVASLEQVRANLDTLENIGFFSKCAVTDLVELPSDYSQELGRSVSRYAKLDRDVPLTDLLLAISAGIRDFVEWRRPPKGRRPNLPLERAVRVLLPDIENLTGQQAKIRWNKTKDKPPESASVVTDALVAILRSFDANLTDISIFNMIEKVRTKPMKPLMVSPLPRGQKSRG